MLLPPNMRDEQVARRLNIDRAQCEANWQQLANLSLEERGELQAKLHQLYREREFPSATDPEQMLYSGFFADSDRRLMTQVRKLSGEELRSEEHTSELQSRGHLVCRLLLEKKKA